MNVIYTQLAVTKEVVKRTWKERLFTKPWNPIPSTKEITTPAILQCGDDFLVHPALKAKFVYQLTKENLYSTVYRVRSTPLGPSPSDIGGV